MGLLSFLFKKNKQKIETFIKRDAIILDVRTILEYNEAHIENAVHIPLSQLKHHLHDIKKFNKPIIAHCKSGVRSAKAVKILKIAKLEAVNGGGIADLKYFISNVKKA